MNKIADRYNIICVNGMWPKKIILGISIIIIGIQVFANELEDYLIPKPKKTVLAPNTESLAASTKELTELYNFLNQIKYTDFTGTIEHRHQLVNNRILVIRLDSSLFAPQAYNLRVTQDSISIIGGDKAALFYGKLTLLQIFDYSFSENRGLPCLTIEDWPDFERRGYMLDISRDKVPTMQTIYQVIDMLAAWKINELQLYTEHTFAYQDHKVVWENSSPITPEEARLIDRYCHERYIDLVPNQNSFGHMENWLKHDEYLYLAECKESCKTIWGLSKRQSLDPTNPGSFKLMQELYAELLPNFSTTYFNIGCDETVELGLGSSKPECDKIGKGRVYLDYLVQLNNEVNKHGRKAQFWGDIILNHPDLISELPQNMTAMIWGYSATYPFEENLAKFKNTGLDYYVCPGTSTWRSLIGRNHNAFQNLKNAAVYGKKYGAKGYLNTDWGDYGHWQPLSVSYPAILIGASYAWNYDEGALEKLDFQLNHYVFKDETGNMAKALLTLGDAYLKTNIPAGNANAFHLMLRRYKWTMKGQYQTKKLNAEGLQKAEKEIAGALEMLKISQPKCADSTILKNEINLAANLAVHGIHLGLYRLGAKKLSTKNISPKNKQVLYNEFKPLIEEHRKLWIVRNRPGGLNDSAAKLEELLNYYK